jgi:hypothetical protein
MSARTPRSRIASLVGTALLIGIATSAVRADFLTYAGTATQEAAWRAALGGSVPLVNFESFNGVGGPGFGGDALAALPAVHVVFNSPLPGVYVDAQWAHSGTKQWCNWAGGGGNSASHVLRPEPGREILALGFWNTDPQGNQPMDAYDAGDHLIGTISGHVNTHNSQPGLSDGFAGFISTTPIAYVKIPGALGDGWNHFDDLQVVTRVTADYNHNGIVDAADYVVWLATVNRTGTNLAADGSGASGIPDGVVDSYDYDFWRANFGNVVGVAAGTGLSTSFLLQCRNQRRCCRSRSGYSRFFRTGTSGEIGNGRL